MAERLTREQAQIVGAFLGIPVGPLDDLIEFAEEVLDQSPITVAEFLAEPDSTIGQLTIRERLRVRVRPMLQAVLPGSDDVDADWRAAMFEQPIQGIAFKDYSPARPAPFDDAGDPVVPDSWVEPAIETPTVIEELFDDLRGL